MVSPSMSSCEHTLNTLRYADRVKELGAADPANAQYKVSPSESLENRMDDDVMSPEDSDLAQLRSLNEGELSADWYNFQVTRSRVFPRALSNVVAIRRTSLPTSKSSRKIWWSHIVQRSGTCSTGSKKTRTSSP
jgi:hypothetical protein